MEKDRFKEFQFIGGERRICRYSRGEWKREKHTFKYHRSVRTCEGEIWLNGHRVSSKDYRKLSKTFNIKIGYLFQNFALIDDVSVYENLNIVQSLGNKSEKRQKIIEALRRVGFEEEVLKQKIYELSGGEQQRIAVARIMLYDSDIILADEPTGSLDRKNKEIVMRLLKKLQKENKTILMVSHDDESLEYCSRVVCL